MKAFGFHLGQYGDLCMNIVTCKAFKEQHPDSHLTFNIGKKYEEIKHIFYHNKYIDDIHIWNGYNSNWPTEEDKKYIESISYDIFYDPMVGPRPNWQTERHQVEEVCLIRDLTPPKDLRVELNKYFDTYTGYKKYISICYKGATDSNKKSLQEQKIDEICNLIIKYGYKPLFYQNQYKSYDYINESFFEAIKYMLSTKMLITIDSAMCWIASGYEFPTIGLYNKNYYAQYGANTSKNWQPINKNAIYLEADSPNNINIDLIENALKSL